MKADYFKKAISGVENFATVCVKFDDFTTADVYEIHYDYENSAVIIVAKSQKPSGKIKSVLANQDINVGSKNSIPIYIEQWTKGIYDEDTGLWEFKTSSGNVRFSTRSILNNDKFVIIREVNDDAN